MLASIRTIQEELVDWKLHIGRCTRQILCQKWITKGKTVNLFWWLKFLLHPYS